MARRPTKQEELIQRKENLGLADIVFIKNLLSTLCKMPYTPVFDEYLRHYFVQLLGEDEVDRHYIANKNKDTDISFDLLKTNIVRFANSYLPEHADKIIILFFDKAFKIKIKNELNEKSGSILLDEAYYKELEFSMRPIRSFCGANLYVRSTINIVTAPPGGGKSLFILSEALYQALINHYKVIVFIVGDMNEYATITRCRKIVEHMKQKYHGINIATYLDNLTLVVEPYGNITIYDIAKRISGDEFYDFVFIDYDDNLINLDASMENLYVAAARPYTVMDEHKTGKVIVFASQGKPSSWREKEKISVGFLTSSSRKEHMADAIYIMQKPDKENKNYYELFILKDRHGLNGAGQSVAAMTLKDGALHVESQPPF